MTAITLPTLACVAAMHFTVSGQVTHLTPLEDGTKAKFADEVPNNGFVFERRPEQWEIGLSLAQYNEYDSGGGLVWLQQTGLLKWYKGQVVSVEISACPDNTLSSVIERWNVFRPASK